METNDFSKSITPSLDSPLSTASMTSDSVFCHGSSIGYLSITPIEATTQRFSYVLTPLHSPRPETPRPISNTARKLKYSPTSSIGTVPEDCIKTPSEGNSHNTSSVIEGIEQPSSSQSLLIKNNTHSAVWHQDPMKMIWKLLDIKSQCHPRQIQMEVGHGIITLQAPF